MLINRLDNCLIIVHITFLAIKAIRRFIMGSLINAITDVMGMMILTGISTGFSVLFIMWLEPWSDERSSAGKVKEWITDKIKCWQSKNDYEAEL